MTDDSFGPSLWLSSVPLLRLDEHKLPNGSRSGCLIDYGGKRILLTVSHGISAQENWGIQLRYLPGSGVEVYQIGAMHYLTAVSLVGEGREDVDFSYVEVPSTTVAYRQEVDCLTGLINTEVPIRVHAPSLNEVPTADDRYGFCGLIKLEREEHFGRQYLSGDYQVVSGLTFLRSVNDLHYFALPIEHPGHEFYRGCSGAPILGSRGSLVALLCGGCTATNEIWGINLQRYKVPIDILVGNVG